MDLDASLFADAIALFVVALIPSSGLAALVGHTLAGRICVVAANLERSVTQHEKGPHARYGPACHSD